MSLPHVAQLTQPLHDLLLVLNAAAPLHGPFQILFPRGQIGNLTRVVSHLATSGDRRERGSRAILSPRPDRLQRLLRQHERHVRGDDREIRDHAPAADRLTPAKMTGLLVFGAVTAAATVATFLVLILAGSRKHRAPSAGVPLSHPVPPSASRCPACGGREPTGSADCSRCGTALPRPPVSSDWIPGTRESHRMEGSKAESLPGPARKG